MYFFNKHNRPVKKEVLSVTLAQLSSIGQSCHQYTALYLHDQQSIYMAHKPQDVDIRQLKDCPSVGDLSVSQLILLMGDGHYQRQLMHDLKYTWNKWLHELDQGLETDMFMCFTLAQHHKHHVMLNLICSAHLVDNASELMIGCLIDVIDNSTPTPHAVINGISNKQQQCFRMIKPNCKALVIELNTEEKQLLRSIRCGHNIYQCEEIMQVSKTKLYSLRDALLRKTGLDHIAQVALFCHSLGIL